ncbi:MAG: zf-HC2 domain-containing protein [Acidobacteriaceae bacterium]|nr:zf-HC2 domain-containing protein [Acidobacteriaceae bacterium]
MTRLLTCKQFLQELNDFLDEKLDPKIRAELQKHVNECPNCWVVCDTTEKTLKVFKGMEMQAIPPAIHERLMEAIEKKCKSRRSQAPEDTLQA